MTKLNNKSGKAGSRYIVPPADKYIPELSSNSVGCLIRSTKPRIAINEISSSRPIGAVLKSLIKRLIIAIRTRSGQITF